MDCKDGKYLKWKFNAKKWEPSSEVIFTMKIIYI